MIAVAVAVDIGGAVVGLGFGRTVFVSLGRWRVIIGLLGYWVTGVKCSVLTVYSLTVFTLLIKTLFSAFAISLQVFWFSLPISKRSVTVFVSRLNNLISVTGKERGIIAIFKSLFG